MKKLLLFLIILFVLSACGGNDPEESEQDSANNEPEEVETQESEAEDTESAEEAVEVDKGLLNVEVTLPATMADTLVEDKEATFANAEAEGMELTENEDGSLTYKMSKSKHQEMMDELREQINQSVEEIANSEDFPSIQEVSGNDDFSEFTMIVDQEQYENSLDGFGAFGIGLAAMLYQLYDGAAPDEYNVTIHVENTDGEEFDTIHYPEALENAGE
ncbi:hypothetical protein [Gracilibacillus alcaliphilus]|uniref:hypothetical protein n=1 Tax=Gracilibacillus alcaliphilus TaxID=1401441 RepID=UPI00195A88A8|nr:hypothetical protein [Gracilibacillus alcaliphilus]MBM7676777.1 hypothetical protein [Gracilibacillus alcaliphilus]